MDWQSSLRSARWLLPWVCMLGLSSALAYAADGGLHRVLAEPTPTPTPTSDEPSLKILSVLQIEITDHDGKPVRELVCLGHLDGRSSVSIQISDNNSDVNLYLNSVCVTQPEPPPVQRPGPSD